jgi:hypothetical protein
MICPQILITSYKIFKNEQNDYEIEYQLFLFF